MISNPWERVRLTALFDPASETVISLRWNVRDTGKLKEYDQVAARYPRANFLKKVFQEKICVAPDYCPRGVVYHDESMGLGLAAVANDGVINSITWWSPGISWEPAPRGNKFKSCFQ